MIRSLFTLLVPVIFLYPLCPLLLIEAIIGKFNKELKSRSSLKLVQAVFKAMLFFTGTAINVYGLENVPDDEAVLYIANHRSYFDIIIGYTLVKGRCGFIAKEQMKKIPLLGNWMSNLNCLLLNRDDIRQGLQTILTAIEYIKSGISIWIFPEGTRTPGNEMQEFKEGSFKIATKSKCKIIPVAIQNTEEILENHMPKIKPATVSFTFGKPIDVTALSAEEKKFIGRYVQNKISGMLEEKRQASLNQ